MNNRHIYLVNTRKVVAGVASIVFACLAATSAIADSPREQFNQLVEHLRKTPTDNALREQIIKLAQDLKPPQVVPEEARRAFVRGNTALSDAKGPEDYARAAQYYTEAMAIAPWWGDIYYNNARARELQQEYAQAIVNIKLFLLSNPPPEEARKAKDYQYALEEKHDRTMRAKAVGDANAARYTGRWDGFTQIVNVSANGSGCVVTSEPTNLGPTGGIGEIENTRQVGSCKIVDGRLRLQLIGHVVSKEGRDVIDTRYQMTCDWQISADGNSLDQGKLVEDFGSSRVVLVNGSTVESGLPKQWCEYKNFRRLR